MDNPTLPAPPPPPSGMAPPWANGRLPDAEPVPRGQRPDLRRPPVPVADEGNDEEGVELPFLGILTDVEEVVPLPWGVLFTMTFHILGQEEGEVVALSSPLDKRRTKVLLALSVRQIDGRSFRFNEGEDTNSQDDFNARYAAISAWPEPLVDAAAEAYARATRQPYLAKKAVERDPFGASAAGPNGAPSAPSATSADAG